MKSYKLIFNQFGKPRCCRGLSSRNHCKNDTADRVSLVYVPHCSIYRKCALQLTALVCNIAQDTTCPEGASSWRDLILCPFTRLTGTTLDVATNSTKGNCNTFMLLPKKGGWMKKNLLCLVCLSSAHFTTSNCLIVEILEFIQDIPYTAYRFIYFSLFL